MPPRDDHALHESEKIYTKAAKAELERDYDRAFQLYVKAADEFLHLGRTTTDIMFRTTCKSEAKKALDRAEKIKRVKSDLSPVIADYLSTREQALVLEKSSVINGLLCPLWTDDSQTEQSDITVQPKLSPEQLAKSAVWRKCSLALLVDAESPLLPQDVVQHVISDCSVCASIAVCIEHGHRFGSRLGQSALYPQDAEGVPIVAQDGRYSLRILFNGGYRRVDIDDQLPTYPDGTLMCMSTGAKSILWPSLVEKAYMKLMGGYDFPGSLSSADLHALTGWIPEYIDLMSSDFEREKTWRRIAGGFKEGLCLITVGTGERLSIKQVGPMSLLSAHCYAVTDISDDLEHRTMTVLDTWTGVSYMQSSVDDAADELNFSTLKLEEEDRARSCVLPWSVVCSTFQGIYLNWNPILFNFQENFNGMWRVDPSIDVSCPRHFRLQLKINPSAEGSKHRDVWLLLSRHVVDSHRRDEYISLSVDGDDVVEHNALSIKGEYTSTTHVLVKTSYITTSPILSVMASYDGTYADVGFTISAYASSPCTWAEGPAKLLYREVVSGTFTSKSAGGNPTLPTFMLNPQYHLRIHPEMTKTHTTGRGPRTHINATLQSDRHFPLNLAIVWSQGQRITEIVDSDTAASSGTYNYGHATITRDLLPGDYSLIVSAFEPRHIGPYKLEVNSSTRFDLNPIAQEGAGMFSKVIHGSWTEETAGGGPSFKKYTTNPVFKIDVPSHSQLIVRLQLSRPNSQSSINITIFHSTQRLGLGSHIATSGPYSDAVCGVVTPQVSLQPGVYFAIPSTFSSGVKSAFKMIVYTSTAGVSVSQTALGRK